jgi:hypothetical protein
MRTDVTTAAIVGLACGACASQHHVDSGPPQMVDASIALQPGAVLEGAWDGGPGDVLSIMLAVDNPVLDWDVHTHDNGGTQTYIVEFAVTDASYTLDPSHDSTWYLLVKNTGSATENLTAKLALTPGTTWSGWPP